MRTFKNPQNGYTETVDAFSGVLALMFGWFYLGFRGLWAHILAQGVLAILFWAAFGPPGTLFVIAVWIVYAFITPSLIARRYQRIGWHEVHEASLDMDLSKITRPDESVLDAQGWTRRPEVVKPPPDMPLPAAPAAPPSSVADELTKLVALRDQGILTESEFTEQKQRVLDRP